MNMIRTTLLSCCLFFDACPGLALQRPDYPLEITGELKNFPPAAAGYKRSGMTMFKPDMEDYSVSYDFSGPLLNNIVSLYFYNGFPDLASQWEVEKEQIPRAHFSAKLLSERPATFRKNGVTYPALVATYRYEEIVEARQLQFFTELILVSHPLRFFKVRSTSLFSEATAAAAKTRELIEAIDWAK